MPLTVDHPGPIYIRLAKGYDPIVTNDDTPFRIGEAIPMRSGSDALIVTTGIGLRVALAAAETLEAEGVDTAILHTPTVKPLDTVAVLEGVAGVPVVVSVEEHTIVGGLGSAVAELIAETDFGVVKRFKRIGLPDVFPEKYGSQDGLMEYYGISSDGIAATIRELRAV